MNKKKILFILLFIMLILVPKKANATELCTNAKKNEYMRAVNKVKLTYDLNVDENNIPHFRILIGGVPEKVAVEYNKETIFVGTAEEDSYIIPYDFEGGNKYSFKFKVASGYTCQYEQLTTKSIKLPVYNIYSVDERCIEYEEFPMCNKYYSGKIGSFAYFDEKFKEYINSIKTNEVPVYKDERNIFQKFIDLYKDNIEISVALTAILVLAIIGFVVYKIMQKAKRVKVKI